MDNKELLILHILYFLIQPLHVTLTVSRGKYEKVECGSYFVNFSDFA